MAGAATQADCAVVDDDAPVRLGERCEQNADLARDEMTRYAGAVRVLVLPTSPA